MLNQLVVVGRLIETPTFIKDEKNNRYKFTISVPRGYKNIDGEYEVDHISFLVWHNIAENLISLCYKGDLLGVKGHIETMDSKIVIIGDKVTFLSTKQNNDK